MLVCLKLVGSICLKPNSRRLKAQKKLLKKKRKQRRRQLRRQAAYTTVVRLCAAWGRDRSDYCSMKGRLLVLEIDMLSMCALCLRADGLQTERRSLAESTSCLGGQLCSSFRNFRLRLEEVWSRRELARQKEETTMTQTPETLPGPYVPWSFVDAFVPWLC